MEFLSAGSDKVVIWPGGNEEFSLSRAPLHGEIAFGIDENALALVGDETEAMDTIVGGEEEE